MKQLFTSLIFLLSLSPLIYSQAGELDPSFGVDGIVNWDVSGSNDNGHGIKVQSDGKIVIAMTGRFPDEESGNFDIAVVRLMPDGSIDSTFATNGVYQHENPVGSDLVYHLELLDDDKIMVSGGYSSTEFDQDFILIKLNADGTLDTAFGDNGSAIQKIGVGEDYARSFTIADNGNILVGGFSKVPGFSFSRHVVSRFTATGIVDSTFGTDGVFMWNDNETTNETHNIEIAPDGNIITSGRSKPFGANRLCIYKILADGSSLDSTFAINGEVLAPYEGTAYGMTIHSNGNILITGSNSTQAGNDLVVLAYNQDGAPNTDFAQDGVFIFDLNINDVGLAILEQTDGKIIASGESGGTLFSGPERAFVSVRLNADGSTDESWGGEGYVRTITSTWMAFSNASTIQADGKVLLTGVNASDQNDLQVIRYGNFVDADMDGYGLEDDCNDDEMAINPGEEETPYNGIDDDCNPLTLDDDLDQDGFNMADDCDDTNANVNIDAEEIPYNGLDDDCDPSTLDDDLDQDGFLLADDCDDTNADINDDAEEIPNNGIDEDCDGSDLVVGVKETALAQQFKVYPNPTGGQVNIELQEDIFVAYIQVLDYSGKVVRLVQPNSINNKFHVSLHDLPSGLWVLAIQTDQGLALKRVVKY